jgi:hypothetical protein
MADDTMKIAILVLQDLMDPVNKLDIGIATQLAEYGGAFHGFIRQRVQFAEQGGAADFRHA